MKVLIAVALTAGVFAMPLVGAVVGISSGWIVGLFFEDTILSILQQTGIEGVEMWQVGCFLGFISGFFKPLSLTKD